MGCVLLSSHDEPVADLLTHDLNGDDTFPIIHIVEDSIVAEPQLPGRDGVGPHRLESTGLPGRFVA
jgi:hypothetical protein